MLLSVGMIVKNEETRLEKCLSALVPVLSAVGGELVIADTGSTDSTVEIARKYTDRVFHFDWVKDFSAARNFTLEMSRGEWFMFIDADEVLIDGQELVQFFTSGEYRKYNSASYIQRNYSDSAMKEYSDYTVHRIVRVTPRTHFVNPVHEVIEPFEAPTKQLSTAVAHSGYIYSSEQQKLDKFHRNTELLLKRFNTESDPSPLLYLQLGQSFALYDEERALEYFKAGIEKSRLTGDASFFPLYNETAVHYYRKKEWNMTAQVCRDYFRDRQGSFPAATDCEMHGILALALQYSGDFSGAYAEHISCRELWRERDEGRLDTPDMRLACFFVTTETNRPAMHDSFLEVCLLLNKYTEAAALTDGAPDNDLLRAENRFRTAVIRADGDITGLFFEWGRLCKRLSTPDSTARSGADAAAAIEKGDRKECISALIGLVRVCPEMKRAVMQVRDSIEELSELDRLAAEVKETIRTLAASGNTAQAAALLKEFEQLSPGDKDIPALRSIIPSNAASNDPCHKT